MKSVKAYHFLENEVKNNTKLEPIKKLIAFFIGLFFVVFSYTVSYFYFEIDFFFEAIINFTCLLIIGGLHLKTNFKKIRYDDILSIILFFFLVITVVISTTFNLFELKVLSAHILIGILFIVSLGLQLYKTNIKNSNDNTDSEYNLLLDKNYQAILSNYDELVFLNKNKKKYSRLHQRVCNCCLIH